MKLGRLKSWTFGAGGDQLLHIALLVRDRVNLQVSDGRAIPPRLEFQLPPISSSLNSTQLQQAATEWQGWWDDLLNHAVHAQHNRPMGRLSMQDQLAWLRTLRAEALRLSDPPEFDALSDRPALQTAAREAYPDRDQASEHQQRVKQAEMAAARLESPSPRDVVKEVAARNKVRRAALHGNATIFVVEGTWWDYIAPGNVGCSANAMHDPAVARTVLTAAFESSLSPPT